MVAPLLWVLYVLFIAFSHFQEGGCAAAVGSLCAVYRLFTLSGRWLRRCCGFSMCCLSLVHTFRKVVAPLLWVLYVLFITCSHFQEGGCAATVGSLCAVYHLFTLSGRWLRRCCGFSLHCLSLVHTFRKVVAPLLWVPYALFITCSHFQEGGCAATVGSLCAVYHLFTLSGRWLRRCCGFSMRCLSLVHTFRKVVAPLLWVLYALFIACIGVSRCYLSAHFPHQIIGGMIAGTLNVHMSMVCDQNKIDM